MLPPPTVCNKSKCHRGVILTAVSVRCEVRPESFACVRCEKRGQPCVFDSNPRFRKVQHVDSFSKGRRHRSHLVFDDDQPWMPTCSQIEFVHEEGTDIQCATTETNECPNSALGETDVAHIAGLTIPESERDVATSEEQPPMLDDATYLAGKCSPPRNEGLSDSLVMTTPSSFHTTRGLQEAELETVEAVRGEAFSRRRQRSLCPTISGSDVYGSQGEQSDFAVLRLGSPYSDPVLDYPETQVSDANSPNNFVDGAKSAGKAPAILSHKEALLVQHYINRLAPWVSFPFCPADGSLTQ